MPICVEHGARLGLFLSVLFKSMCLEGPNPELDTTRLTGNCSQHIVKQVWFPLQALCARVFLRKVQFRELSGRYFFGRFKPGIIYTCIRIWVSACPSTITFIGQCETEVVVPGG